MKKFLLTALLSVIVLGSIVAQIRWQTNTTIGQELKAINTADKDTLILDFKNTVLFNSVSIWAKAKAAANIGKDSVVKKTLQTQRGIQVKAFLNSTTTTAYENGTFKCNNAGSNGNPGRVASLDSLKRYLEKSIITGTINGNLNDSLTRPAACLFNVGTDEIAFGMYPGKAKVIEYIYRFDYTGKACSDDITFQIDTYDAGTSGKTAIYTMAVYKSSVSTANLLGDTVNVYTTGQGLKNVSVAQEIGVTPADLSNKSLYIVVKTLGTSNASGVVDGVCHAVDAGNLPIATDPIVVFDNFVAIYASSSWAYPAGVVASAVLNHNNNNPVVTVSTDWTGGDAVLVSGGVETPVKLRFSSVDRIGIIEIKEANDGGGHAAAFSFAETGAIKKKDGSGNYTVDVPYTRTINVDTGVYSLLVAAPTSGSVSDDIEVTMLANAPLAATRAVRLELTNGVRFWYNVSVTGTTGTSLDIVSGSMKFIVADGKIMAQEAVSGMQVYSVAGQLVKSVNATAAAAGVAVQPGMYIVKSGAEVQKVIVR